MNRSGGHMEIDPAGNTVLHAGRFRMLFTEGRLQWISVGPVEVVRRVYFAYRDASWTTIPFTIDSIRARQEHDAFELSYAATVHAEDGDFEFTCEITGSSDDVLDIRLRGRALADLRKNRVGLCVHYPHELGGRPLRAWHATDPTERPGSFPDLIAPYQPLKDLGGIAHPVTAELWAHATFRGDLFEMEDQRNFGDASFKVYSTPAADPIPALLAAGEVVDQHITLALREETALLETGRELPHSERYLGAAALENLSVGREAQEIEVEVSVEDRIAGTVPAIGTDISRYCGTDDGSERTLDAPYRASDDAAHDAAQEAAVE
jgi:hypothetical protein